MFRFFILFSVTFIVSSCGTNNEQDNRKVFNYNESSGISSLDPIYTRSLENMWAVNQLFDGLVELDSALQVVPLIAKEWEILDSGTTYVFNLRSNVFFHTNEEFPNPRKVIALDFVYSFNRIMDEGNASPGKWIFNKVDFNNQEGFSAPNDTTFVIHLKDAFPPFLGMLSMQYCNVVPREAVEFYGKDFRSHPIGTGPFKFAFWYENIALIFHKNDSFWQKDSKGNSLPYLDAVKIDFVKDVSAEYLGLLKGSYDFISGIHNSYKDELLDPNGDLNSLYSQELYFQRTPFIKTDYLGILIDDSLSIVKNSPLKSKLVRQAINYGINRKEMIKYLRNNAVFDASHGFIPKGLPSYNEDKNYGYHYDPLKAKKLLKEAGYNSNNKLPAISLSTTADYVDLCEYIQHNLAEIGLEVSIDVLPSSAHREGVSKSKINFFRKSWLADYVDAENFLGLFYSKNFCPNGPNYTHYFNPEFDQLFEQAAKEVTNEIRYNLYQKMDSLVMSDAPIIPLFYDQVSHFISNDITYFETNAVNMLNLKNTVKR